VHDGADHVSVTRSKVGVSRRDLDERRTLEVFGDAIGNHAEILSPEKGSDNFSPSKRA